VTGALPGSSVPELRQFVRAFFVVASPCGGFVSQLPGGPGRFVRALQKNRSCNPRDAGPRRGGPAPIWAALRDIGGGWWIAMPRRASGSSVHDRSTLMVAG
jgi:hypothetical protein